MILSRSLRGTRQRCFAATMGFTLIELFVVIAIIDGWSVCSYGGSVE